MHWWQSSVCPQTTKTSSVSCLTISRDWKTSELSGRKPIYNAGTVAPFRERKAKKVKVTGRLMLRRKICAISYEGETDELQSSNLAEGWITMTRIDRRHALWIHRAYSAYVTSSVSCVCPFYLHEEAVVKVVLWSTGAHLTKPGWSKPYTHSNPTNLALFRHKITLYRFNQGAHTIAGGGSNGSKGWVPPTPPSL